MNKETRKLLDKHFETAFDTPDGIKKLRELILTLAMRGRLVPQNPNDQPASELLKEIAAEKARLIKEGKLKLQKPLPPIDPKEIPYEIPASWSWIRVDELGITQTGTTPPSKEKENFGNHIPFIGPGNIKNYSIDYSGAGLSEEGLSKGRIIAKNSILMVCIGGSIGKHAKNDREITCNQQINTLSPFKALSVNYLFYAMASSEFQKMVLKMAGGSATPIINKQKWSSIPIAVPPLAEQKRIVARVEQLMARCDELEKLRAARDEKRLETHAAALNALFAAADSGDFSTAWKFISRNFDELYTVKENVAELRKAILQLAVMGRLVPQDPDDQPASELLKEIAAEKARLIKEGKLKPQKPLPPISPEEVPFNIPADWQWIRLGDCVSALGDGLHGTPIFHETGEFFFINGNNLSDGIIEIKRDTKRVSESEYNKYRKELNSRTVLVSINGTIGNVAFYNNEKVILGKSACYFNLFHQINKLYMKKVITGQYFLRYAFAAATGSTIKNVSLNAMREFLLPLPPLKEQERIVARIEQLMALCDGLEQSIAAADGSRVALLDSLMANV